MNAPSLAQTQTVLTLLQIPESARDRAWLSRFSASVIDACFEVPNQGVFTGPDGFPYLALQPPPPSGDFTQASVATVLERCTAEGLGLVVAPDWTPAGCVFSYGDLWSLRSYGSFAGVPPDPKPTSPLTERRVLLAAPADDLFPSWARSAVRHFLGHAVEISEPSVCLLIDPGLSPSQNLVFNVFTDSPPPAMPFDEIMARLKWFMPQGRGLIALPHDAIAAARFLPL